jgi:hypothetical protein
MLGLPEWIPQLSWLLLVTAAAAWCANREPALGWKSGAIVIAVQPLAIFVIMLFSGALLHPSSSTGGPVALFILTVFMAILSPVPIVAGVIAAYFRRGRSTHNAPDVT